MDEEGKKGEPGEPGMPGQGRRGGEGGKGGAGGSGHPEGGGGVGGAGGEGGAGEVGNSNELEHRIDDAPDFEKRVAEVLNYRHRWRWRGLSLWIIAMSAAVILGIRANTHRISDVQASRIESCERTYEGIRTVFKPFFPDPKTADSTQLRNLIRFNNILDRLKRQCDTQTRVNSVPK
jgi:hypothetical protein